MIARAAQFAEELLVCDVDRRGRAPHGCATRASALPRAARASSVASSGASPRRRATPTRGARPAAPLAERLDDDAEVYAALVLGTRDYVDKNGFEHVVLGLSGGIDSTLVALVAVDALGADRVTSVVMPSPYSS